MPYKLAEDRNRNRRGRRTQEQRLYRAKKKLDPQWRKNQNRKKNAAKLRQAERDPDFKLLLRLRNILNAGRYHHNAKRRLGTGFTQRKQSTSLSKVIWAKVSKMKARQGAEELPPPTARGLRDRLVANPTCYLTGRTIDLHNEEWNLDHILPVSRGGGHEHENLGLTIPAANRAKSDLTLPEFLDLCEEVLRHHGRL